MRHFSLTTQRKSPTHGWTQPRNERSISDVLSESPEFAGRDVHDVRVRTRLFVAATAAVLVATVVGGAPAPAHARTAAATSPVSCTTGRLPLAKGHPVHLSASLNGATATLRGTSGHAFGQIPRVLQPRLTLSSPQGTTSFQPEPVPDTPGNGILVLGVPVAGGGAPALCLAQFGQTPVAVVGVTSAFNQCCFLLDTYAPGVQSRSALQDGLAGAQLRVVGGRPVIVTGDGRFFARFTDYADSPAPLRVLTVRDGRQRDVTDSFASQLRDEAGKWWSQFDQRPSHGLGYLAAWAADQERLGHDSHVWSTLAELDDAGKLDGMSGWPRGQAYISALKSFLGSHGYRG